MNRRRWVGLGVFVGLVACAVLFGYALVIRLYVGVGNYSAISGASVMRSLRVHAPTPKEIVIAHQSGAEPMPTTFEPGPVLNEEQHEMVRRELLSYSSYDMLSGRSRCMFHPDLRFECVDARGAVRGTVTFCFSCSQVRLEGAGGDRTIDLPRSKTVLTALAVELFPNDAKLRALHEKP